MCQATLLVVAAQSSECIILIPSLHFPSRTVTPLPHAHELRNFPPRFVCDDYRVLHTSRSCPGTTVGSRAIEVLSRCWRAACAPLSPWRDPPWNPSTVLDRNESGEETHRPSSRSHRLWSRRSVCGGTGHRHPTTPPPPPQPPLSASRPAHLASPPRLTHAGSLMPEEVGCIPPLHLQPGPTTPSLPPPPHQTPPPQPDPVVHGRGSRQRWRTRSWGDRHPCGRG